VVLDVTIARPDTAVQAYRGAPIAAARVQQNMSLHARTYVLPGRSIPRQRSRPSQCPLSARPGGGQAVRRRCWAGPGRSLRSGVPLKPGRWPAPSRSRSSGAFQDVGTTGGGVNQSSSSSRCTWCAPCRFDGTGPTHARGTFLLLIVASTYVRLAYQPPASGTFLSEQTSHQQSTSSTFLSQQISTSHQPNEQAEAVCLSLGAAPLAPDAWGSRIYVLRPSAPGDGLPHFIRFPCVFCRKLGLQRGTGAATSNVVGSHLLHIPRDSGPPLAASAPPRRLAATAPNDHVLMLGRQRRQRRRREQEMEMERTTSSPQIAHRCSHGKRRAADAVGDGDECSRRRWRLDPNTPMQSDLAAFAAGEEEGATSMMTSLCSGARSSPLLCASACRRGRACPHWWRGRGPPPLQQLTPRPPKFRRRARLRSAASPPPSPLRQVRPQIRLPLLAKRG
jgi:hypothetical protein